MRNSIVLVFLCLLAGCASNFGYRGESLEQIRSRHKEMVREYKYGSAAREIQGEGLEEEFSDLSEDEGGGLYLLAIGVEDYVQLPNIDGAEREARMFALTLKKDYGFRIRVLTDPTRAEILSAMKRYREELGRDSRLVVYYAGRGWLDEASGQGYWLPRDARGEDRENWLSTAEIAACLRVMDVEKVMVVANSCYQASAQSSEGETPHDVDSAQRVRVVLTSGDAASEGGEVDSKNPAFASALLDTLQNSREPITGTDLYLAVKAGVEARQQPAPRYGVIPDSGHQGGDFVFVPLGKGTDMN